MKEIPIKLHPSLHIPINKWTNPRRLAMHRLHFIEIVQTRKHLLFNLLRLYAVCSEMRNQNNMKMPMSERHIPCEQSRSLLCNEQNKRPFLSSHAVLLLVGLAAKSNNSSCCYDELKRCIFNYKKKTSRWRAFLA